MKKDPINPAEAEEAAWWRENSDLLSKQLRAAVKTGESINPEGLRQRIEASKRKRATVVALRIPQADLAMARKQAQQKGLPYQTYIKSLLHEALAKQEKRDLGQKRGVPQTTDKPKGRKGSKGKETVGWVPFEAAIPKTPKLFPSLFSYQIQPLTDEKTVLARQPGDPSRRGATTSVDG